MEISCLPLQNVGQESPSNAIYEGQIPHIVIRHPSIPNDDMSQFGKNGTEQNEAEATVAVEPPAEKKGAIRALRR